MNLMIIDVPLQDVNIAGTIHSGMQMSLLSALIFTVAVLQRDAGIQITWLVCVTNNIFILNSTGQKNAISFTTILAWKDMITLLSGCREFTDTSLGNGGR